MNALIGLSLLLLIIPCALFAGIGFAQFRSAPLNAAAHVAPAAAYLLVIIYPALAYFRAFAMHEQHANWQRASELVRRVELAQPMELRGWVPLVPGVLLSVATLWAAALALRSEAWIVLAFAILLAAYAIVNVLRGFPHLSAPLLSCDRHGIRTGAYGAFSWHEIAGITLKRVSYRGFTFHTLLVHVPQLPELQSRMHPCTRFLYAFARGKRRTHLFLRMAFSGEHSEVIALVCRTLWERAITQDERPDGRDALERARPPDNELRQREIARLPRYRNGTVAGIAVTVVLLLYAWHVLASAPLFP